MTTNQIKLRDVVETERSNAAREAETNRANLAKEQETNRHNIKTEEIDASRNEWERNVAIANATTKGVENTTKSVNNIMKSIPIIGWFTK